MFWILPPGRQSSSFGSSMRYCSPPIIESPIISVSTVWVYFKLPIGIAFVPVVWSVVLISAACASDAFSCWVQVTGPGPGFWFDTIVTGFPCRGQLSSHHSFLCQNLFNNTISLFALCRAVHDSCQPLHQVGVKSFRFIIVDWDSAGPTSVAQRTSSPVWSRLDISDLFSLELGTLFLFFAYM